MLEIEREGKHLVPVNRLLGFLFAQHTRFDDIMALLHDEPLLAEAVKVVDSA